MLCVHVLSELLQKCFYSAGKIHKRGHLERQRKFWDTSWRIEVEYDAETLRTNVNFRLIVRNFYQGHVFNRQCCCCSSLWLGNSCRLENYFCSASMLLPHPNTTHMNTPKSEERPPNSGVRDHPRSTWKQHYSPLRNKSAVWKYFLVLEKSANWLLSRRQHRLLCFISVRLKRTGVLKFIRDVLSGETVT